MAYASACGSASGVASELQSSAAVTSASGVASELQRSRCITDRVDEETQQWVAPETRVHKKLWRRNEHIESKRMRVEDDWRKLVECVSRVKESRPQPKFRAGQSVHHYWAPWFPGCSRFIM